jgi:endoglucanase
MTHVNVTRGKRTRSVAVIGIALLALIAGCSDDAPTTPEVRDTATELPPPTAVKPPHAKGDASPLAGRKLYVDPHSSAATQVATWRGEGRTADADAVATIADQPTAIWLTADAGAVEGQVRDVVRDATRDGSTPVLVAYNIPHRDCGGYSKGGAASPEAYRDWIDAIARGVEGRPAIVILEPDAIPHVLDGCVTDGIDERLDLLAEAVKKLEATGNAYVYLDAGNPNWIDDVPKLARTLRRAGVTSADGFSLNVSNFVTLADNLAFGKRLSDSVGKAHFVVDTSRDGNGALTPGGEVDGGPTWCNPPGRALGRPPTTTSGHARVDALLWVKYPGESDGACRPGEPEAGQWWPDYALALVAGAKE